MKEGAGRVTHTHLPFAVGMNTSLAEHAAFAAERGIVGRVAGRTVAAGWTAGWTAAAGHADVVVVPLLSACMMRWNVFKT